MLGWEALVEPVGGAGDRPADAAGGLIALDREHVPVAATPRLGQGVGQERQGAGLALGVTHQQVDEAALEPEPGLASPAPRSPRAGGRR